MLAFRTETHLIYHPVGLTAQILGLGDLEMPEKGLKLGIASGLYLHNLLVRKKYKKR
jgi:hypothetical protein